jgi:hypothetical protein
VGIDLTTVSVSLDILTVNAEAGPDTLPTDIQAIEPIAIWTESTVGRVPIDIDMSDTNITSRYAENYSPAIAYGTEKFSTDKIQIPIIKDIDPLSLISQSQDLSISTTNTVASTREIPATSLSLNISNATPSHYTENLTNGTMIRLEDKTEIISNNATKTSHLIKTNLVPIQIKGFNTRSPIIQNLSKVNINISGHTDPAATDLLGAAGAFEMTLTNHTNQVADGSNPVFNELFDTPGTHSWTCPAGVSSVSVVCVGAGGSGGWQWSSGGGGGGGLGWKNNIAVTAGQSYSVVVGDHGGEVANAYNATTGIGGNSYFISTSTVCGFGAGGGGLDYAGNTKSTGHGAHGGGYSGDGGGAGGDGAVGGGWTEGGGGAGGYSGDGASRQTNTTASGGGGGAGQYYSSTYGVGAGGGVGVHGEGTSGTTFANGTGYGGKGGSGGGDGMAGESAERSSSNIWTRSALDNTTVRNTIVGGQYGGGGGGSGTTRGGGPGGTGAVKLVFKTSGSATLEFPSTNVGEIPTAGTTTTQVSNPIPVFVENPSHTYSRSETINSNFDKITFDTKLSKNYGSSYPINNLDSILTNNGVDDEFITQKFPSLRFDIKNTIFPSIGNSKLPKQQFSKISFDTKLLKNYGSGYHLKDLPIETVPVTGRNSIRNDFERLSVETKNEIFTNNIIKLENFKINRVSIMSETDKSATSPVFCNSLSFNFRIKGSDYTEWGHFTDNHIKTMKVLTKFNDPRLTSVSSSSSSSSSEGDSESSGSNGTGPVQTWN